MNTKEILTRISLVSTVFIISISYAHSSSTVLLSQNNELLLVNENNKIDNKNKGKKINKNNKTNEINEADGVDG